MPEGKFWNERQETMDREERGRFQGEKAIQMFRFAYENSPYYKKKFQDIGLEPGDIKTMDDFFSKVPYTCKQDLIDSQENTPPYGDFFTASPHQIVKVYVSPGPIIEPHTADDIEALTEHTAMGFYTNGLRKGDVMQITQNYHLVPAGGISEDGGRRVGATIIPTGTGNTEIQVDLMKKLKTTVFRGTPSFLVRISEVIIEKGLDPRKDFSLRLGIFGAEPLAPVRKRLSDTFGIECRENYGIGEIGIISRECPAGGGLHIDEDLFLFEIIDPKTGNRLQPGEEGEIVLTNLKRKSIPQIRYRTGDATIVNLEKCECGRTEAKIVRILGRVDSMTKVRGIFIHPKLVEKVVSRHPELGRYQIVVERPGALDEITVKLECLKPVNELAGMKDTLAREMKESLRIDSDLELMEKGSMPDSAKVLLDKREY